MAHDVFISYSIKDKPVADAVCGTLEARGIRCWIASRDIRPSSSWVSAIMDGITQSQVMVLIWSANARDSPDVTREVHHAFKKGVAVIPFRVEDVAFRKELEFFLQTVHWLDALTPPLEAHLVRLAETLKALLHKDGAASGQARPAPSKAARDLHRSSGAANSLWDMSRSRPVMIGGLVMLTLAGALALIVPLAGNQTSSNVNRDDVPQLTKLNRDDDRKTSSLNRDDPLPAEQQPPNLWLMEKKSDDQYYFAKVLKNYQNEYLVELWDVRQKSAKLLSRFCCHSFEIKEVFFSPNDKFLVVADEKTTIVWNWFEHKKWIEAETYNELEGIKFLDEGTSLEWAHLNGPSKLLNIHTGQIKFSQLDNSLMVPPKLKPTGKE